MADEDKRYTDWLRTQPCAACATTFRIEIHHSLYGTTYSPDEPRPPKAIEGARKGMSQRSHDYFALPLCIKDHIPGVHKLGGFFAGRSRTWANSWEEEQVATHRRRYAMQAPSPAVPAAGRPKRGRPHSDWTVAGVLSLIRREATHRPADVSAALTEIANLIEKEIF